MKNLLLIVMLISTSAAAQEFSFDTEAMGKILAGTQALKVKHAGQPAADPVYRYDPKDLRFEKTEGEVKLIRVNDVLYKYSSIDVRHKGAVIATFHVYDPKIVWRGWEADKMLMESLESIRLSAMRRGLPVILNYTALARHSGPGSWEPELLGEIIRAENPL
jgi:hypothetical protein